MAWTGERQASPPRATLATPCRFRTCSSLLPVACRQPCEAFVSSDAVIKQPPPPPLHNLSLRLLRPPVHSCHLHVPALGRQKSSRTQTFMSSQSVMALAAPHLSSRGPEAEARAL